MKEQRDRDLTFDDANRSSASSRSPGLKYISSLLPPFYTTQIFFLLATKIRALNMHRKKGGKGSLNANVQFNAIKPVPERSEDRTKNQTPPTLLSSLRSVLFVIGTVVAGFAAFCNSLTWHLQRFWGASGDFWQARWDKILDTVGDDPVTLWVYGSMALMFVVYWLFGGIYTLLDITNRPVALRRYKIQPGTNEPVDSRALCKVIAQVLFNQIVVGLPIVYGGYHLMEWRGYPPMRELPTFHWVLAEIAIHILFEEIGFYYSHRMLHSRYLYKYIHKQHHQWTAPIAVTALYCNPLEHIGSNLIPPFLGVFIVGSHVATAYLWFSLALLSTLNAHSGYHLPFFPSPEAHDFHHLKFNQCFGVLGVLDRLHGTDTQFRNSRACSRHVMMLSLVPPREAFPDAVKYSKSN